MPELKIRYKYTESKKELQREQYKKQKLRKQKLIEENPDEYIKQKVKHRKNNYYSHIKRKYGLSKEEYNSLMSLQNNKCYLCERSKLNLVVDHDHQNGKVRKLLCSTCNMAIGAFKEDTDLMRKTIAYLESFRKEKMKGGSKDEKDND